MEKVDIFKDIAERTGGDIYLGVVGAVGQENQHLLKSLWNLVVLPNIEHEAEELEHKMNCLKVQLEKQS